MNIRTGSGLVHQGKAGGEVRRHGSQARVVCLSTKKVRVSKPRLRRKGGGKQAEVPISAYEAMQSDVAFQEKLRSILLRGVSTRTYQDAIPRCQNRRTHLRSRFWPSLPHTNLASGREPHTSAPARQWRYPRAIPALSFPRPSPPVRPRLPLPSRTPPPSPPSGPSTPEPHDAQADPCPC